MTVLVTQKIKILKKWKKKIIIIIKLRYYHFTHAYHKLRSYGVWFLRYNAQGTSSFVILGHFLSFNPAHNLENQHFEKIEKRPRDIIVLHVSTINENHMMYGSWDMEPDKQNFMSFFAIFCPFTPQTIQKIKILKKLKTYLQISSFYTRVP